MIQQTSARNASYYNSMRVRGIFAAIAFFICIFTAAQANAATYTVTNTLDTGAGSLRQAVLDANATAAADVIVFNIPAASCNATTGVCTITLASQISVQSAGGALTISGTGANRLAISGGGVTSIFFSSSPAFTLSGVTITNGKSGSGGGMSVGGGTTTIRAVNFTNNTATGTRGGGIYLYGGTNHRIENSSFSGNKTTTGTHGGAIAIEVDVTVVNTTISGNTAAFAGGGIHNNGGVLTLRNCTIVGNMAGSGGGVFIQTGLNIGNTIIAGNTVGSSPNDIGFQGGTTTTAGYNLIGVNTNAATQFPAGNPNANNDIVGTSGAGAINARLAPLGNYGGTVPTQALCTAANVPDASCTGASPAIDQGSAVAGVATDARGVIRPYDIFTTANASGGSGADIGAFELQTSIIKDFGYNSYGQLGLGDLTSKSVPTTLTGFNDITAFGGGYQHSVALRSNGTVVTAGDNSNGQLGSGLTGGNRPTFAQATIAGCAAPNSITQVSGGGFHNIALCSDGTVWAWGQGALGQLGNGANADSATPVQAAATGANAAGFNGRVVALSSGLYHNLAITDDGKLWAWGFNSNGQLGDGTTTDRNRPQPVIASAGGAQVSGIEQISGGEFHSAALTSGGAVLVWGNNANGQVGNGTTAANVLYPTQTTNTLMGTVVQISAGSYHNVAVNTLGDVYAWGRGGNGQIGDNNTADALVPRKTSIVSNVVRVEAHGAYHTLARRRDGTLFVWGYNPIGEIGNGTTTDQLTPLNISAAAGTGGNLGTNIAVFGAGVFTSFASTLPEIATPAGANTLRGDNFSVAFPASTTAGTTQVRTFDPTATGLTVPVGYTIEANSTGYDITSTSTFTGNAQVCLKVSEVIDLTTFNKLTILHDDNFDGIFDAPGAVTKNYQKREVCRVTQSFSPFVLAQALAPTAANISVGGRVLVGKGSGLTNATVEIILANGETRTTRTGSFGYYRFDGIQAGQTVIVSVVSKKYSFAPQVVSVGDDLTELNFLALE